jgi:hypothetical protein
LDLKAVHRQRALAVDSSKGRDFWGRGRLAAALAASASQGWGPPTAPAEAAGARVATTLAEIGQAAAAGAARMNIQQDETSWASLARISSGANAERW